MTLQAQDISLCTTTNPYTANAGSNLSTQARVAPQRLICVCLSDASRYPSANAGTNRATRPEDGWLDETGTVLRQAGARVSEANDLLDSIAATDKARRPGEKWPSQHEFHADASMLLAHIDMAFPEGSPMRGGSRPQPAGLDMLSALTLLDSVGAHWLAFHEKWLAPELVDRIQASSDTPDA